jgi:hypothetical protein
VESGKWKVESGGNPTLLPYINNNGDPKGRRYYFRFTLYTYHFTLYKCGWGDSNPHALRHQILSLARLPITTHPRIVRQKYTKSQKAAPILERLFGFCLRRSFWGYVLCLSAGFGITRCFPELVLLCCRPLEA